MSALPLLEPASGAGLSPPAIRGHRRRLRTVVELEALQLLDLMHQHLSIGQQFDNGFMALRLIGRDAEGKRETMAWLHSLLS